MQARRAIASFNTSRLMGKGAFMSEETSDAQARWIRDFQTRKERAKKELFQLLDKHPASVLPINGTGK
jgi:hypothetical protein